MLGNFVENSFGHGGPIHFAVPPNVLWWSFGFTLFIFFIFSAIFLYHWGTYSYRPVKTSLIGGTYFIGSVTLLGIALISIMSYLASVPL